jgi:hypothetical protein
VGYQVANVHTVVSVDGGSRHTDAEHHRVHQVSWLYSYINASGQRVLWSRNEVALAVFASKDVFEQYQEANSDRLAALRTFHAWQAKRPKEAANVPSEVADDIAEAVKKAQISISRLAQKIRAETTRA